MLEKINHNFQQIFLANHLTKKRFYLQLFLVGSLLDLAFAPFNQIIFAFISIGIFYSIIHQINDLKKVFFASFFYNFGFFVFGIYWICNSLLIDPLAFAWLIPFAITLIPALMAIYFATMIYTYKYLMQKFKIKSPSLKIFFFAFFWFLSELIRSILFTGFPWNLLGYMWFFSENMVQVASLIGVDALGFLLILFILNWNLFLAKTAKKIDKIFGVFLIFLWLSMWLYGYFKIEKNYPQNLEKIGKFRLVQANIEQKNKWQEDEKIQNFELHQNLTSAKDFQDVDAILWSETSIPEIIAPQNNSLIQAISSMASKNRYLISGGIHLEGSDYNNYQIWNSMFVFDENGVHQFYDKQHLVPFGEYVPLHQYFSFLFIDDVVNKITGGGVGFSSGQGEKLIKLPKFSFIPLLCYEVIFSKELVNENNINADLMINLTNDSWFGKATGPYQHLQMAQMRAIEFAKPMLRVAQTGITANINHYGKIIDKIDLNKQGVIDVEVYKNPETSFYAKNQHLAILAIFLFNVIIILILYFRKFF
ncbi:MAG: apolipoprotein N-acyltransferase [Rickettsiales bacterium]